MNGSRGGSEWMCGAEGMYLDRAKSEFRCVGAERRG